MVSATVSNPAGDIVETYTYDYLGNRTSKTSNGVTTKFTTDLSSGYAQVLKAEKDSEVTYYTRGFELISKTTNGETVFYLYDGGSSVRALTDESGAVTDTLVFDAFGNETEKTGTTENSYGFQGEEQDATGLYYLRARYLDPATGTFTSMDTYGGSLSDPMSLHKYLFANSNPVKYCDPSGHMSLTEFELSEAIDEILMSSLSFGMAYIGMVADNPNISDTEKFAGYLGALALGALFPFGVALLHAMVSVLVAGFVLAGLSLCFTVVSTQIDSEKHPTTSALAGIAAGACWGAALGCLGSAFAGKARKSDELIHISSEEAEGSGEPKDINDEIDEWYKKSNPFEASNKKVKHYQTRHNPHKVGEILRGGGSYNPKDTYFSENWSVQQIDDAVQISCNTAVKSGFTDGQFSMTCYGEKVTVCFEKGSFKTAYGDYHYTYDELIGM